MSTDVTGDVLVVGAGPVGLTAALLAARAGLQVTVIDREWRIAARSYACVLHPHSLDLLEQFGVLERATDLGVRIDTVRFYEGAERKAELSLSGLPTRHPHALALYQDDLEGLLEDALREQHGVKVQWGRRLAAVEWGLDTVTAVVEFLQHAPTGDPARQWQEVVDRRSRLRSRFVLGADGPRSQLAHALGAGSDAAGEPVTCAIYEFEPQADAGRELRVAVDASTINTLWPLPGGACRWTLEVPEPAPQSGGAADRPQEAITVLEAPVGGGGRRRLLERIQQVAPWFTPGVRNLDWAMRLEFPRRVARQFGRGGCWLMGDAAHQTTPGGAQSMNVAFNEAAEWVDAARRVLREGEAPALLAETSARWRAHWERLLNLKPALRATPKASDWVRAHASRLLGCIPASGPHLAALLGGLGLEWDDSDSPALAPADSASKS